MEAKRTFTFKVTLPDGKMVIERVYACTKWHAMSLLFPRMMDIQPNRSCYRLMRNKSVLR
jgi:hypothetical protein